MAISFNEKLALVKKYKPKNPNETFEKTLKIADNIDSPKITDAVRNQVKSNIDKLYDKIKAKIEESKQSSAQAPVTTHAKTRKPRKAVPKENTLMGLASKIREEEKITWKEAVAKSKAHFASLKQAKSRDAKKVLVDFRKKIGRKKYALATKGTDIAKDKEIPALPKGKRIVRKSGNTTNQYGTFKNKVGGVYYENRANRTDVNQPSKSAYPKLADGGLIKSEIEKNYSLAGVDDGGVWTYSKRVADEIAKKYHGSVQEDGSKWYVSTSKFADGGEVDDIKVGDYVLVKNNPYWDGGRGAEKSFRRKVTMIDVAGNDKYFIFADGSASSSKYVHPIKKNISRSKLADGGEVHNLEIGKEVEVELNNGKIVKGKIEKINPLKIRTDATSTQVIPNGAIKNIETYAKGGKVVKKLKSTKELYEKLSEAERNWKKDNGKEYKQVEQEIKDNRKLYFELLSEAEFNWKKDDGAEYKRLMAMRNQFANGGKIGFEGLAKKVARSYKGKKVKSEYQDEYGKTYDAKEAKEVGEKVASKVYRKQLARKGKMAKGGISDSNKRFVLEVRDGKTNELLEERVYRYNRYKDALQEAQDDEQEFISKYGNHLHFELKEKYTKGGEVSKVKNGDIFNLILDENFGIKTEPFKAVVKVVDDEVNSRGQVTVLHLEGKMKGIKTDMQVSALKNEYAKGGEIAESNYKMALNKSKELCHHINELHSVLKKEKSLEAWVIAKIERATSDLSDVTHYLDGVSAEHK